MTETYTYEVRIERVITYATECATLRVLAASVTEAEDTAAGMYDKGEVTFSDVEVQDCSVSYIAEELTPEGRIATLMRVIRDIQAKTVDSSLPDDDIIGVIQGYCKYVVELEKQVKAP